MTDTTAGLRAHGIEKSYGGTQALRGAALTCLPGEVHALIGENGAGKSTMVKALAGAVRLDAGEVLLDGSKLDLRSPGQARAAGIGTAFQELSLVPDLSVASNLLFDREPRRLGRISLRRLRDEARAALDGIGLGDIDPAASVRELALPERQLIEIAKVMLTDPHVLILDEATSALLPSQVTWLLERAREFAARGRVVVFISHRLDEIERVSDRVTVFRGGIDVGGGPTSELPEADLVELMIGRRLERFYPPPLAPPRDEVLCELRGFGAPPKVRGIDLEIHAGEIVGIGGLQGQGQLELFLALYGVGGHQGEVVMEGSALSLSSPADALSAGIALVPEDRATDGLCLTLSIRDNISLGNLGAISRRGFVSSALENALVNGAVRDLQVQTTDVRQEVLALSGGNQQKVLLGRVVARAPVLLLMYDATRGVDVGTKHEIYELMRAECARGRAILFFSTDAGELVNLADRVLVLHDGVARVELAGDDLSEAAIVAASVGGRRESAA